MPVKIIQPTPSAYAYPLLIKHLLHTPLAFAPEQEITWPAAWPASAWKPGRPWR